MSSYNPLNPLSGPGPQQRRRNPLWRFRRLFFVLGVMAVVALSGVWAFASQVELQEDNFEALIQTTYICTAEVTTNCGPTNATNEISRQGEERILVDYEDIPDIVVQAVLSTEDKTFFDHSGADPRGLTRAAYQIGKQKLQGETVSLQGGSTITQQYIKLATEDDADALSRKAREIVRAIKLEQELADELGSKQAAKETILERYLNRAYFGRSVYGIAAASQVYFGKDLADVTLPEAAFLAGVIRNPSNAEPNNNLEEAERRREVTLGAMVRDGYITEAQAAAAAADAWSSLLPPPEIEGGLGVVKGSDIGTEYFVSEVVFGELSRLFPEGYSTRGLRVYTTLDPNLQRIAYDSVYGQLDPAKHPDMPLGSLLSLDDQNRVVALVGGNDWDNSQVNLATARGGSGFQAGSQMKVFAVAEYVEQGFSLNSYYDGYQFKQPFDEECGAKTYFGTARPTADRPSHRTVYQATASSINSIFVQIALDVGSSNMVDMARRLGIESFMQECPNTALGSNQVSPMEMANSYSTLLHEGNRMDPVFIDRIEDADGNVLCYFPEDTCTKQTPDGRVGEQVVEPTVARQVVGAMEGVVNGGTGRRARLVYEDGSVRAAAGKTGTTTDNKDAWFTGFTCGLTTSVWVGVPGVSGETPRYMNDDQNLEKAREVAAARSEETGEEVEVELAMAPLAEIFAGTEWEDADEIGGGSIPARIWEQYNLAANAGSPPCDQLPSEGADPSLRVQGQELLTTIPWCLEPAPEQDASDLTTTTVDPNATSSTDTSSSSSTSSTTSSTSTTAVSTTETTPASSTTDQSSSTTAPSEEDVLPDNGGDAQTDQVGDEQALGRVVLGGASSSGWGSGRAFVVPAQGNSNNNEQRQQRKRQQRRGACGDDGARDHHNHRTVPARRTELQAVAHHGHGAGPRAYAVSQRLVIPAACRGKPLS